MKKLFNFRLLVLIGVLIMSVGQMWASKRVYIDVSWNTNYADKMMVHFWGGTNNKFVWASKCSSDWNYMYYADIDDDATTWQVCRGDALDGSKYNYQNNVTYSSNNKYKVNDWDNNGSASSIIGTVTGGHMLFDNSDTKWSESYKYFVIGHDSHYSTYGGNASSYVVSNTKLWCFNIDAAAWPDAKYFAVISHKSSYPSADKAWSDIDTYADHKTSQYTSKYRLDDGSIYMCVPGSGAKPALTITYKSGYSALNSTVTLRAKVSTDGGSSYSEANTPGALTASSYKFTAWNSCGSTTGTSTTLSAGSASSTFTAGYTANTSVTAAEVEGYTFMGWYEGSTKVLDGRTGTMNPHGAVTLYAYYKANQYTVTLNKQGTTSNTPTGSVTATYGQAMPSIATLPAKSGYSFGGFYDAIAGGGNCYYNASGVSQRSYALTSETTLYAKWTTSSITLNKNNSNVGSSDGSIVFTYNKTGHVSYTAATNTDDSYVLKGYYTATSGGTQVIDQNGTLVENVVVDEVTYTDASGKWVYEGSPTLYAQWKQTYSVSYDANYPANATSTGGSAPTDATEYNNGATVTVLGNTGSLTAGGYTFNGWQTETGGGTHYAADETFTISANTVLYAKWVDIKTTVNLVASPTNAGTFTIGGDAATSFSAGLATSPSVTAVPATGFYMNTSATIWTDDANAKLTIWDDDAATTTVGADGSGGTSTLTAAFSAKFVLRGSKDAGGDPAGGMAGWSATTNSSYSSFSYEDGVYTIVAALTAQGTNYKFRIYDVTTSRYHGCSAAGQYIPDNTQWTLDGAGEGYDVHFTTTVIGNYTFVIDVTGDHPKVKIIFPVEPTYSATIVNSNVSGSNVSPRGSVTLKPVTTTAISATVPAGFRFGGWTVDSDHSSSVTFGNASSASTTVTATASGATITATYSQAGFIYFDDSNSDWGKGGSANVHVYFFNSNNGWYDTYNPSDGKGDGLVPANAIGGGAMIRIGYTNIYYFDYQTAGVTPTGYVGFTKGNCYNYYKVQNTSAAWRTDFNSSCYPMYVASSSYTTKNKTGYHSTGYWKNYNVTNSNVWLHGTWDTNKDGDGVDYDDYDAIEFTAVESNSNIFKAEVELSNRDYWFYLHRSCKNEYLKNTGTITTSVKNWEFTPGAASNCKITAPAPGKYIFTLVMNDDKIRLNVDFPLQANDLRLLHYGGYLKTTEGANHSHPSQHVSHLTEANTTVRDTISFFIDKDHKGSIKLQKCTNPGGDGGRGTWADTLVSSSPVTIDISGITKTGIYNFEIVQTTNASGVRTASINRLNNGGEGYEYDGKLYIRTNIADGGWDDYMVARDNQLIYSTIAKSSGYDYYHMHWVPNGTNVKFCIANDYSHCITDSLTGDTWIGGAADYDDSHQTLPHEANVRFMYNSEKNTISRAYLNGAGLNQRFLVFQGDGNSYNSDGSVIAADAEKGLAANELEFDDKGNWVYQLDIKATTGAEVDVIGDYNSKTQNFITDQEMIVTTGGDGTKYPIRVVYDFKTNQLVSAWAPDGSTITVDMSVTADMMLVRTCQDAAKQIHFSSGQKISNIQTMVGAIEFRKDSIVGRVSNFNGDEMSVSGNRANRELMYYISFPFDVAIQDIYGIGQLNKEWYLQYYDGADRAAKGFFRGDGTTTFWKFMNITDTLWAGVGYSLLLDNEYFNTDGDGTVWKNIKAGGSVYLYFPSTEKLPANKVIKSGSASVTLDVHEHTSGRTFEVNSKTLNHNFTDSHWNMMGVPLFENKTDMSAYFDYTADPSAMPAGGKGYFYEWDSIHNELSICNASTYTFKSMHGYMVQYAGTVTFTGSSIQPASIAARRALRNEENYMLELQLLQNNQRVSRTYIELRDEACDTFALNEDVYMIYSSLPADLFTYAGNYDVSANVLSVQNHTIPVGIEVHKTGNYTFTMPSNFSGGATLVDTQTGERTNLALSNYTVSLPKGVCDGRFYIELDLNKMPTAIDGVEGGSLKDGKAHKFIENGVMYILQDGKIYDARGARIQ